MECSVSERRMVSSGGYLAVSRYCWSCRYFFQPPRRTLTMSTSRTSPILASISFATEPHSMPGSLPTASLSLAPAALFSIASRASSVRASRKSLRVSAPSAIGPPFLRHDPGRRVHGLRARVDAGPQPKGESLRGRPVRTDLLLPDVAVGDHAHAGQRGSGMVSHAAPPRDPESGPRGKEGACPRYDPGGEQAHRGANGDRAACRRAHAGKWRLLHDVRPALIGRRIAHDRELEAGPAQNLPRLVQRMLAQIGDGEKGGAELHEDDGPGGDPSAGDRALARHYGARLVRRTLAAHAELESGARRELTGRRQRLLQEFWGE